MATSRKPKAKQAYSYLLQVELEDLTPTIWRQVWVDSGMSLHTLHHVLQATMGWTDAHLHEFSIKENGIPYQTLKTMTVIAATLGNYGAYGLGSRFSHLIPLRWGRGLESPRREAASA